MKFRVKINESDVFDKPGGTKLDELSINEKVTPTGKTDGVFMEVKLDDDTVAWIREADCEPVDPAVRLPVDPGFFVKNCLNAERTINDLASTAPWFVSADFLIARAQIETGITNPGPVAGSDAVGPLRVSSVEWKMFRDNGGALATNYQADGYDHWVKQIIGAAYRMYFDAKTMSDLRIAADKADATKAEKDKATKENPFVPSYLDIFHAYLTNSAAAALAIRGAQDSAAGMGTAIDTVLSGALQQQQIDSLFSSRPQFTGTKPAPKSVKEFVTATETALNDALKKAFDLIKQLAPEELPQVSQGESPWFDVALKAEGIDEHNDADKNTILEYFDATDLGHQTKILAWCGAFAAHCLKTCGNDSAASSIPKGAAAAANWKGWGDALSLQSGDIPVGAVVVLSPSEGTGTTGHVGFFCRFLDGGKVELLGGNQGDKVQKTPFLRSRIAYIGWLGLTAGTSLPEADGPDSSTPISDGAIQLIFEAEVSSQAAYEKLYHKPTWPKGRSGVTIGIGYDIGYTTAQKLKDDWKNLSADMIAQLQGACGVKGPAAGPLAKQLAASGVDVPLTLAMSVLKTIDIPRWVGIVQRALPNTGNLTKDQLGALVSLAYNRGASFSKDGDRYLEMRNIKTHMANRDFAKIPAEFLSMRRLWPDMKGLRDRREKEAALFG